MAVWLLISLCVATVMQLTSSQSTYDVIQQENGVNSCGRTEQMIHELATAVSRLQREVAELKAFIQQKVVNGIDKAKHTSNTLTHHVSY